MGAMKELMEHQQAQREAAIDIAVEAGVLTRCEFHEYVYDPLAGDNKPAYMLGNSKFSKGELRGIFNDRQEMTDTIKAVVEDSGMECPACAKERDD